MSAVVVALARGWLGTPYVHQASVRGAGCDCLGLVRGVWRALYGEEPETPAPYSPDWGETEGEEHLWRACARHLRPVALDAPPGLGEVVLFRMRAGGVAKHLGIISRSPPEAVRFIHAYSKRGVVESALTPPWARRMVARFAFGQINNIS